MLDLRNVTLLCVDGKENSTSLAGLHKALLVSSADILFGSIKFLSASSFRVDEKIDFVDIDHMTWLEYNDFMLRNLVDYVDTEYVINIQEDGFILNPVLWAPEFLDYDYIGAPFSYDLHIGPEAYRYVGAAAAARVRPSVRNKPRSEVNLVGNGGFSLRSSALLAATSRCPFENFEGPEDLYIAVNHYGYFVSEGIRFAPHGLASKFSLNIDMYPDPIEASAHAFGFHGNNMMIERF